MSKSSNHKIRFQDSTQALITRQNGLLKIMDQEKCVVCSADRISLNAYGAPVCLACKSFFLRCVKNRRNQIPLMPCSLKGSCEISDKKSRFLCQTCRWQKCLDSGMKEFLVRRVKKQPLNTRLENIKNGDQHYLETLLVIYQKCFRKELFKRQKISAEFVLNWNKSTLDCIANFVNLLSEFQNYKVSEKEVIITHNIKAMQFILVTNVKDILEDAFQPFLPLLTYNAISSENLMKILRQIELLKLSEKQVALSLVVSLFNQPQKIIDRENVLKKVDNFLKGSFKASWKWKVFSSNIKTLSVYSSTIYVKTKELKYS